MHPSPRGHVLALLAAAPLAAQTAAPAAPQTVPEATGYTQTSRVADVEKFVDALLALPHGDLLSVSVAGKSGEGRELRVVRVARPGAAKDRLRVLVIGNIHAGEVEGKEAIQVLLREFGNGEHGDLLDACELHFLPVYNPDGNERIDPKNRAEQNGPTGGVGRRENGKGLDLNRDFVKAETPECQALLGLFRTIDPHLFMDLHTTDGSYHGYHLTYAPSLGTNVDAGIAALSRKLLDDATAAMDRAHHFQVFDYGNFETRDWDGSGAPGSRGVRGWWTYDHRPRYGTNYFALRNRIAVLSEAYSYCDFRTRIAATRAFVLTVLEAAARRADAVRAACAAADAALAEPGKIEFGFATTFGPPEQLPVLVGEVERVPQEGRGERRERKDVQRPETMPVFRSFVSRQHRALPAAWAIAAPDPAVVEKLRQHGVRCELLAAPRTVSAQQFAVAEQRKGRRSFQGHLEIRLAGTWGEAAARELPAGALVVPADQPLGRLAAQLLEPESEDSLASWNYFETATDTTFPVLRVVAR